MTKCFLVFNIQLIYINTKFNIWNHYKNFKKLIINKIKIRAIFTKN